ncbi:MAG: hypothetical protein HOW73_42695 [Polyangiaceae bacterium]|nr:hypothetical protein [Polyangiaceae bacterium]
MLNRRVFKPMSRTVAGVGVLAGLALFSAGCPEEVDCEAAEPCDDSFALEIIPGGAGFEIGTYHFEMIANDTNFGVDCYITGSADATTCDPMTVGSEEVEKPAFNMVRDENGVVTNFTIGFASAPPSVQVRVTFGGELLADQTYTEYETVQIDPSCPVQCKVFEDTLTVLP